MRKIHLRDKQKNILLSILAVIIACIFLFPLYWIIVNSFKIDSEIFSSVPTLWPKKFTITAYKDLIGNLSVTLKNSVIIALGSMILSLVLSVPAAYGLARYKAGIQCGDIISKIDGTPTESMQSYYTYLQTKKQGENLTITVLRKNSDGEYAEKDYKVTVGER